MKKFLECVAEDIINKYGADLSHIAVVFPNKRASIFLNEQLAIKAQKPIWSPVYITISDFFRQQSSLVIGDPVKLICDIHKSFIECTGIDETLDHFYGWGSLLLADFDDIDKNMADVSNVFKNIQDIHELDDTSYLDDEQKRILHKFFSNFTGNNESELKKRFLKLWCHIEDIYNNFNERLLRQNIAYEGMLYRNVAQKETIDVKYDIYLFVGFNVIQKVEQYVFSFLQKRGKARFYWDFDEYYVSKPNNTYFTENEAGHYIKKYLNVFQNELDSSDPEIYNNFRKKKDITFINSSTENIQARYVSDWLRERERYKKNKNTAIVLCNESLLPTVIHCLPEEMENVNITIGYPLFQAPISSFIIQLLDLKINGYSTDYGTYRIYYVKQILSHPYSMYISKECMALLDYLKIKKIYHPTPKQLHADKNISMIFSQHPNNESLIQQVLDIIKIIASCDNKEKDPFFQESVFRMYTLCNRLSELIKSGDLDIDVITLQKLIIQLINNTTIPFHGEPAEGIQIMGILETRNIDFEHILIISCNEGNMPKGINDSSFIPYSIRKAHGLTTIDNKISIYAYYFYNMIQRASDVTFIYNRSMDFGHTGEMSRFMLQLMLESNFDIKHISLQPRQQLSSTQPKEVCKDKNILDILNAIDHISPTAINRYMRCPLQFYYNNIAQIKEIDEFEDEGMTNRIFGNIFHYASEKIYKKLIDSEDLISSENIKNITRNRALIERIVDDAFLEIVFNKKSRNGHIPEYNGLQLINREVIIRYIYRLLEMDSFLTPFKIKNIESDIYKKMTIITSEGEKNICIGGRVDRIDQISDNRTKAERIRVIDYKTGSSKPKKVNSIEEIFRMPVESNKHYDYYLQAMLYSIIIRHDEQYNSTNLPVSPGLLFIQHSHGNNYDPTISLGKNKIYDIAECENEFCNRLLKILTDIFEPTTPFFPTENKSACARCPYCQLCGI